MTANFRRFARDAEPVHFAEEGPCPSTAEGYLCTGPVGHDGDHYADGDTQCWAAWSDDES